ncbi:lipopolysaccharide assembly protein LapB [Leptolyngbya sp. FACHB-261]|uniref:tetratricopeptide repeat protein n=1 Tax=Leptolyngbya sp. FACHB-261 TaxID=2692806 RepID=UPI00168803A4|nr:hypothetical protein [Leptolyngbya sp. FACHB-261]MBD2104950.1 hypothetical protein [Leptolyngbya sp. FACHB-261]
MDLRTRNPILAIALFLMLAGQAEQALATTTDSDKVRMYTEAAWQYAAIADSDRAIQVLDQALLLTRGMPEKCFQGNSLVRVAGGYWLAGQEAKGKQLLAESIQVARAQAATGCSRSATSPDESLLNRAKEFSQAGHEDIATAIATGMGDPITLAEIANHRAEDGAIKPAKQQVQQALTFAQNVPADYRTLILIGMAERLSQPELKRQMLPVLEQALQQPVEGGELSESESLQIGQKFRIAKQFAEAGQQRRAIEILDQTVPQIRTLVIKLYPGARVSLLSEVAEQYAVLGEQTKATEVLAEARVLAQAIKQPQARDLGLVSVARSYAKVGNFDQAQQIAQAIEEVEEREGALSGIAIGYAKAGEVERATELATQVRSHRNNTLAEIARHYLAQKQYDQALQFAQKWQVKSVFPEIASGYVESGQPDRALQVVKSIPAPPGETQHMQWIFPELARGFAEQGQFEQGLQLARTISERQYKAYALLGIAKQYVQPKTEGGLQGFAAALSDWFQSWFGESDQERSLKILDEVLQVIQSDQ